MDINERLIAHRSKVDQAYQEAVADVEKHAADKAALVRERDALLANIKLVEDRYKQYQILLQKEQEASNAYYDDLGRKIDALGELCRRLPPKEGLRRISEFSKLHGL